MSDCHSIHFKLERLVKPIIQKKTRTISVSELVITGGTETPLEEEYSWTIDEIKAGVLARQAYLDELKSKPKADAPKAPAATGKVDLGF